MRNEPFYDKVNAGLGIVCGIFLFLTAALLVCGLQPLNIINVILAVVTGAFSLICYITASKINLRIESYRASVKNTTREGYDDQQAWNAVTKLFDIVSENEVDRNFIAGMSHSAFEKLMRKDSQSGARKLINDVANYQKNLSVRHASR